MTSSLTNVITSSLQLEVKTVLQLCRIIGSPRALTVKLLIENGEYEQYLDLTMDHGFYEDPSEFADDYLLTEVLRKSPNLPLGIDRRDVALQSFAASEAQCRSTNERILNESEPEWIRPFENVLLGILGDLTTPDLQSIASEFRFGPGATTGVRGVGSSPSDKYDEEIHLTANLISFYKTIVGDRWWEHQNGPLTVVKGNKFTTVPKSAKTDRGICVEPTLNIYVQLGIARLLRSRLRRVGLDLSSQDRNRKAAKRAYTCDLCTIDLSAASDSLAWGLIVKYFPQRWSHLLSVPRSDYTTLPNGDVVELEKFSSMGNGFTFELETLVFYAICRVFVPMEELHEVTVYGDDIIIPRRYATKVIEALNFLGFSVNTRKSFLAGNFFESCGTDWFKGHNVRPFYLRGGKDKIPYSLQIANALRDYSRRRMGNLYCDARFRSLWLELYHMTPSVWRRCLVPLSYGDVGFAVSLQEAQRQIEKPKGGAQGYVCRTVASKPVRVRKRTLGLLLSILAKRTPPKYSFGERYLQHVSGPNHRKISKIDARKGEEPGDTPTKGFEPRRGYLGKLCTRRSVVFQWTDGLDWL